MYLSYVTSNHLPYVESENIIFPGRKLKRAPERAIDIIPEPPAEWPIRVMFFESIFSGKIPSSCITSNI